MRPFVSPGSVRRVVRWILGGVFLYAGILKMQDPQAFADRIADFQILPFALVNLLAISLPIAEILVGVLLMIEFWVECMAFAILLLTALFAMAIASALLRGLVIDCGCFGSGSPSVLKLLLALGRDMLLGTMALFLLVGDWRNSRAPIG